VSRAVSLRVIAGRRGIPLCGHSETAGASCPTTVQSARSHARHQCQERPGTEVDNPVRCGVSRNRYGGGWSSRCASYRRSERTGGGSHCVRVLGLMAGDRVTIAASLCRIANQNCRGPRASWPDGNMPGGASSMPTRLTRLNLSRHRVRVSVASPKLARPVDDA